MKKKTIALLLVMMMIFGVTCGGTIAYLTSTASVTNTFTVGKVAITLDEALVDEYGAEIKGEEDVRIPNEDEDYVGKTGNAYKLIPGHTYTKDPIVHVQPGSEKCYVFVKVENGISAIEAEDNTIAAQIIANKWTALDGESGVYYKIQNAIAETADAEDLIVFKNFTLADEADVTDDPDDENDVDYTGEVIKITAYAIQFDGMKDEVDAWTKVYAAANS